MVIWIVVIVAIVWLNCFFYLRIREHRSLDAYINKLNTDLEYFSKNYEVSIKTVSDTHVEVYMTSAKDDKRLYLGYKNVGFFAHTGSDVGLSPSKEGLDNTRVCKEDALKALRLSLEQNFLKERYA